MRERRKNGEGERYGGKGSVKRGLKRIERDDGTA